MTPKAATPKFSLSVVIPAHNSSPWLPSTLEHLAGALAATAWSAEVIVVDDGSTDDTSSVLDELRPTFEPTLRVISQENSGVFLAVWEGVRQATADVVLILNSRVLVDESAFAYVSDQCGGEVPDQPWNGHVETDSSAPLVGQFWSVPTFVFWGDYLARPRPTLISLENFDRVPKGTGFFLVKKSLFERACLASWPEGNADLTSDDTKVLRYIAGSVPIRLDPGFLATYRPRTTIRRFLSHAWHRGTLFVDSYAGTGRGRNLALLALAALPVVAVPVVVGLAVLAQWWALAVAVALAIVGILVPFVIAVSRRCPPRALASYLIYVVPFGIFFTVGLLRGVVVHRGLLLRRKRATERSGVPA